MPRCIGSAPCAKCTGMRGNSFSALEKLLKTWWDMPKAVDGLPTFLRQSGWSALRW
ncbi:hypothetical protein [Okeania sp. KiyG1]|uniref:hypothetical protein n=1 Tax=Okeania sp. KiyG1 TaxID=2720165 RepID=UPI0019206C29|nr:hypothetical protein [Okeania sp. KiyG1]